MIGWNSCWDTQKLLLFEYPLKVNAAFLFIRKSFRNVKRNRRSGIWKLEQDLFRNDSFILKKSNIIFTILFSYKKKEKGINKTFSQNTNLTLRNVLQAKVFSSRIICHFSNEVLIFLDIWIWRQKLRDSEQKHRSKRKCNNSPEIVICIREKNLSFESVWERKFSGKKRWKVFEENIHSTGSPRCMVHLFFLKSKLKCSSYCQRVKMKYI